MAKDFYEVLGVTRSASQKEIRQAYRALARKFHPDVNPGDPEAEARFKEINRANEVLADAETRKKYDQYGDQWQHADQIEEMRRRQGAAGRGARGPGGAEGYSFSFNAEDLGDLGNLFGGDRGRASTGGGSGGVFDSLFRRAAGRQRGRDVEHTVRVTLEEAYRGTSRTLELREGEEECRICGGAGQLAGATCHACRGSGVAAPVRRLEVNIPAGVADGNRIRVAGKGGSGVNGGVAGDLFLRVEVAPHRTFERKGDDLHVDVDVPVADAALGGEVRVPTLKGKSLALRVPAGTQGGRVFRLAGQGMARSGGGFGDLFARARLVLPERLTDEQRRLFEELRRASDVGDEAEVAS
ncbi:MAG: DnaJ domain-containing protein [Dehalococcoidia bacterium]|nr:DnaJ domain-containing protein [Dehalococcoidia bacterium]